MFTDLEVDAFALAEELVGHVNHTQENGEEIRCHELARAVLRVLKQRITVIGWEPTLVTGKWRMKLLHCSKEQAEEIRKQADAKYTW